MDHLRHIRRRNLRPSTIEQRGRALRRLARCHDLTRVSTEEIEDWLDSRDLEPGSRASEISHIRAFYKWAYIEGRIPVDPTVRLVRPRVPKRLPRPMPEPELAVAVMMAHEPIRSMLLIAAFAGLRACEIARLEGEHVMMGEGVLLVEEGKGGGMSSVPLSPQLRPVFLGLPSSGPLFFLSDGRRMRPHNVSHWCNRYLHGIGISHTLHSLRHRFGTAFYHASGRDLRATQEVMRHLSPVSTAGYTWVDPGHLADAVGRLPNIGAARATPA